MALTVLLGSAWLAGCAEHSVLQRGADQGPRPQLVEPVRSVLPTLKIAPAEPWGASEMPRAARGLAVTAFARGLDHPRTLLVLPGGDVLVAETNAPPRPDDAKGVRGWVMGVVMGIAGAGGPSANRITRLRDVDGDGVAEQREVVISGLNSPFGMALVGDRLYVADTDAVREFVLPEAGSASAAPLGAGRLLAPLPAGPLNHHWTKGLVASPDGRTLYVSVGSNSNVGENGLDVERDRARILEIDRRSGATRVFATGLRNPVGMAWWTDGSLWVVVNERDELGSDLVPDYLTAVRAGDDFGWPWVWYGSHPDLRAPPPRPVGGAATRVPDYALGSHVAPLGLVAASGSPVAAALDRPGAPDGMFVGLHGSWNRRPLAGYQVVWVPFRAGRPQGLPVEVLTDFVDADGRARGRPVGVAVDARGALLVADDVGGAVWRVAPAR
ncbi:MAG: sorbosone dehydrogenase family protein [Rubrivivax sp.]